MKFEVIYKFLLLCVLIISLLCVVISGVGLLWGWPIDSLLNVHISFALLLVAGLLLHMLNRKNKLVKINTQFADLVLRNRYPSYCNLDRLIMTFEHFSIVQIAEQLNLNLATLQQELVAGKINVKIFTALCGKIFRITTRRFCCRYDCAETSLYATPIESKLKGH